MGLAACANFGGIDIENALVVGLAVAGIDFRNLRVHLVVVGVQAVLHHTEAAVRGNRALERSIRLQTDNLFEGLVDIARSVSEDGRTHLGRNIKDNLFAFLLQEVADLVHDFICAFRRRSEERAIPFVGSVVVLNKITDVYAVAPGFTLESAPSSAVTF